jgi:hypothetical protein
MLRFIREIVWGLAVLTDLGALWIALAGLRSLLLLREAFLTGTSQPDALAQAITGLLPLAYASAIAVVTTCLALAIDRLSRTLE